MLTGIHEIETPRLWLRCFEPEDADALQAVLAASRAHLARFLPWAEAEPQSRADKLAWILARRADFDLGLERVFGLFRGPRDAARAAGPSAHPAPRPWSAPGPAEERPGTLLGGIGMHPRGNGPGSLELGYWLAQPHLGRGYAREAVAALLRFGFEHLGLNKLEIRIAPDNRASRRIPEALGFRLDGVLRAQLEAPGDQPPMDACVYSLLEPEFRALRAGLAPIACFDAQGSRLTPGWG